MEKIISEVKRKMDERNAMMIEEYKQHMAIGSDRTAVYVYLANKYGLKRSASVYKILKDAGVVEKPKRKRKR